MADTSPPAGPSDRAGQAHCDSLRPTQAGAAEFIESLLSGRDDVELTPCEFTRLETYLRKQIETEATDRGQREVRRSQTGVNRNKLKLIWDYNRRLRQRKTVDERVSKLYAERPRGLDPELADAFCAIAIGIRECTRLIESVPFLWTEEAEYRRLAVGVADAASAARSAYMAVDIRLRRVGGPNPMLEALNNVLTVQDHAPLDPAGTPGGLNAILTRLHTTTSALFPRVDGKGITDRMLDQLAHVSPVKHSVAAAPACSEVAPAGEPLPPFFNDLPPEERAALLQTRQERQQESDATQALKSLTPTVEDVRRVVEYYRRRCLEYRPGQSVRAHIPDRRDLSSFMERITCRDHVLPCFEALHVMGVRAGITKLPEWTGEPTAVPAALTMLDTFALALPSTDAASGNGKQLSKDPPPAPGGEGEGGKTPATVIPEWIWRHFRQQQQALLSRLWGGRDVPASELADDLGYTNERTALENLHRRVTATNDGLFSKASEIGEQWEISQRTRAGALHYYLHPVAK